QGVTQTADGTIWYATIAEGHSVFVGIDPESLEETARIDMPAGIGTVACGWGAWRSTAFKGDHTTGNLWFTTGAGSIVGGGTYYYRFNPKTDDPATIEPFFSLAGVKGINGFGEEVEQMNYGTSIFDPRNNRLIVMTGVKGAASGQYRDHWIHFVDGTTGEITKTIKLNPYYWFQSLPILPDRHDAVIDLDDIKMDVSDEPLTIDLTDKISDKDNIDKNIRLSVAPQPALLAADNENTSPLTVTLENRRLTVTPNLAGTHTFSLVAESNGRPVTKTVSVTVSDVKTGLHDINSIGSVRCDGNNIYINGFNGTVFNLYSVTGQKVSTFEVDSDNYIISLENQRGIYILKGAAYTEKIVIK
ncbi:MAG: DUF5074 domain-containing protein, partial [Duncaniella sp.]|nr:DUF5074 domain-containing protein [Duncaniella sp.]